MSCSFSCPWNDLEVCFFKGVRNFLCKLVYSAGVFNATNNITA